MNRPPMLMAGAMLVALSVKIAELMVGPPPKIWVMATGTATAVSVVEVPFPMAVMLLALLVWPKLMIGAAFADAAASRANVETLAKSFITVGSPLVSRSGMLPNQDS